MAAQSITELRHDQTHTEPARKRPHPALRIPRFEKIHEAADRALDHYLCPPGSTPPPYSPRAMYAVTADTKNEDLLANACETLASAKTIAQEFAGLVKPSQRRTLMGIAQLIMLGELAVNRVLDNLELPS